MAQVGRVVNDTAGGNRPFSPLFLYANKLTTDRYGGLPTGILYSPQFRPHQETKIAASRTHRSRSREQFIFTPL